MLDDLNERDGHGEAARNRSDKPADVRGPMADREVPLAPTATSDVIHRWLDGELPEPAGLRGEGARGVELWRQIGEETERRRRMVTPPHVAARIMASLPDVRAVAVPTPWWKQEVRLSPGAAVAMVAGAFALGLVVMRLIAR